MSAKTRDKWRIHLGLVLGEIVCVSAFAIEISRALSGNTLSWAYVVEWPVLGAYAIYMWRKLLKDEDFPVDSYDSAPEESIARDERQEAQLAAWNQYLHDVHVRDSPQGPTQ